MSVLFKHTLLVLLLGLIPFSSMAQETDSLSFVNHLHAKNNERKIELGLRLGFSGSTIMGSDACNLRGSLNQYAQSQQFGTSRLGMLWTPELGVFISTYFLNNKLGFRTGLLYQRLGSKELLQEKLNRDNVYRDVRRTKRNTLQIPVAFCYRPTKNFEISAGVHIGFVLNSEILWKSKLVVNGNASNFENEISFMDFYDNEGKSVLVGGSLGFTYHLSRFFSLYLESHLSSKWFSGDITKIDIYNLQPTVEPSDLRSVGLSMGLQLNILSP